MELTRYVAVATATHLSINEPSCSGRSRQLVLGLEPVPAVEPVSPVEPMPAVETVPTETVPTETVPA